LEPRADRRDVEEAVENLPNNQKVKAYEVMRRTPLINSDTVPYSCVEEIFGVQEAPKIVRPR